MVIAGIIRSRDDAVCETACAECRTSDERDDPGGYVADVDHVFERESEHFVNHRSTGTRNLGTRLQSSVPGTWGKTNLRLSLLHVTANDL